MAERAEIVILGAGFAGAATAWHLARRGATGVLVLEGEAGPGLHASGRNAGVVFQCLRDLDEGRLVVEGRRFYERPPRSFSERPLFRRTGSLLLAGEAGVAALEDAARDAARLGLAVERRSASEASRRVPLAEGAPIAGALEILDDGVVDIHNLLVAYLGGARLGGTRIRYRARATAIGERGGRVAWVEAAGERIETPVVVNAAGAWAGEVGELAGVGDRGLRAFRRHRYRIRPERAVDPSWPFVWHQDVDVYLRPEERVLLGSPCDADPHPASDPSVDPAAERLLREKLLRAFPALGRVEVLEARACLRTFAPDQRFLIGRDPELEGLVWVAGLGGHGMSASHGIGRLAAAAVLGEDLPELRPFDPGRIRRAS